MTKTKTFVIGDIHGGLRALQQVLTKAQVQIGDQLIFLGDYVDGWSESAAVIDFLMDLQTKQDCVFIRGNHDELLSKYLKTNSYHEEWYKHGGESTIKAYSVIDTVTKKRHINFLDNELQNYYIDSQNRLFIHAGFTNVKGVEFEYFEAMYYWDRTLWETALSLNPNLKITDDFYPNRFKLYDEIYIGHTPVTRIGEKVPIQKACIWNVDTGAAFHGKLTLMNVDTKEFFQSDALPDLYPDENGRN